MYKLTAKYSGLIAIALSIALVAILVSIKPSPTKGEVSPSVLSVATVKVEPDFYRSLIRSQGVIKPRWQTNLSSEVSGRVLKVSDQLLVGSRFKKGEVLALIDPVRYRAAYSEAKSGLAKAEQNFRLEQQQAQSARQEWDESGFTGAAGDLVLRTPQLATAKASVEAAKLTLKLAENDLSNATIRAPYNGYVVSRNINPGEFIEAGRVIASLYSDNLMEVRLPLTSSQFSQLPSSLTEIDVNLESTYSKESWAGRAKRLTKVIDTNDRWRELIVVVESEHSPLSGEFVNADFKGLELGPLLKLPESTLSRDRYIWHVVEGRLRSFPAKIQFSEDAHVFVLPPQEIAKQSFEVVLSPTNSMLEGARVNAESLSTGEF